MTGLHFRDAAGAADLRTFAGRAARLDRAAVLRLVAAGDVLAGYACALHGGGGPTVLGLRTQRLAGPAAVDVTVPVSALLPRLDGRPLLELPDAAAPAAAWAGVLPPREGWSLDGVLDEQLLRSTARAGIAEVAGGTHARAGSAAVAGLRARVWGRPLPDGPVPAGLAPDGPAPAGVAPDGPAPAGVAFAAQVLGFLGSDAPGDGPVSLHRCGPWWRVSLARGHVLARAASPF